MEVGEKAQEKGLMVWHGAIVSEPQKLVERSILRV